MTSDYPTKKFSWQRYILALVITLLLFGTIFYATERVNRHKISLVRDTYDEIALDILSTETRFSLLNDASCETFSTRPVLAEELSVVGQRVGFLEQELGAGSDNVVQLKKYFSLLQTKDYILTSRLAERCNIDLPIVLYFYTKDCPDCRRQGYVLDEIHDDFEGVVRTYAFDASLDISALNTLMSLNGVNQFPAIVLAGETYEGFQDVETITNLLEPFDIGITVVGPQPLPAE